MTSLHIVFLKYGHIVYTLIRNLLTVNLHDTYFWESVDEDVTSNIFLYQFNSKVLFKNKIYKEHHNIIAAKPDRDWSVNLVSGRISFGEAAIRPF